MSVHNLLRLVRNLREERDREIIYDNRKSSWNTILRKHPLESKSNESLFHDMQHCKEYLGASGEQTQVMLRPGHTWLILQKIAKNSLHDCATFYEVAKHTMLNKEGVLNNSIHLWFKKALTALYLSHNNAPDSLNYSSILDQKGKESALAMAFQNYGVDAIPAYEKLKDDFNIEHFNEKLIFWYWETDGSTNNLVDQVIDKLGEKRPLKYDLQYIAENFKPNNLLKEQSVEINKRFIPFSEIEVLTERYEVKSDKVYSLMKEETDKTTLDVIFSLFCSQVLLKSLMNRRLKESNQISSNYSDPAEFLGENKYNYPSEIFKAWNLPKETRKSMEEFINHNKSFSESFPTSQIFKNFKGTVKVEMLSYWNEVQATFAEKVLNEDLKQDLDTKNIKKNVNKI